MQFIVTPEDIEEWESLPLGIDDEDNEPQSYNEAIGLDDYDVMGDR